MSFVIWYQVELSSPGLGRPVLVSNDVLSGSLIVDAEIRVAMTEGAATDSFEVTLVNLPLSTTELIRAAHATTPVTVSIRLGYFDEPATRTGDGGRVLVGRLTRITGCVGEDGYARTVLYGQEEAGYRLRNTRAAVDRAAVTTALELATALIGQARVSLAPNATLPGDLTGFTVRNGSTLDALRQLADRTATPLVVRDGRVLLGAAVGAADDRAPTTLHPDVNIVSLGTVDGEDTFGQPDPPVRSTVSLVVLGHPGLRVGQVASIDGLAGLPSGPLRLARVVHQFSTADGYTAALELIAANPGQRASLTAGAQLVVDRWRDLVDRSRDDHPAIDVGEVTRYVSGADGKHEASLHYAQFPDPTVDRPSVASPVDATVDLHDKPVASVFAFDRTGLIVPVYPGMRALLAHNRGSVNDAVLAGFVWPENPLLRRPANQPGDYWLALPTGLGPDGRPAGPGANDLIDAGGRRVVQVAGLHIQVGTEALPEVGTRPVPPDDNTITIEHHSGTRITVGTDGAVTISTSDSPITLTNGAVSLTLDGATVAVS